jgi:3-phosphoshikimate 1-carboxyvinyltransferase
MNNCPDIAQTLCVTAAALKIPFEISGLETLGKRNRSSFSFT